MSKRHLVHNTQEIEKLFGVARFMLDLCQLHGVRITPRLLDSILNGDLSKETVAPPRLDKSYIHHKLGAKLDTIPEVSELDVLGQDS